MYIYRFHVVVAIDYLNHVFIDKKMYFNTRNNQINNL
jgi:hypothetical protein